MKMFVVFAFLLLGGQLFAQSFYKVLGYPQLTAVKSRGGFVDMAGNNLLVSVEQAGYPTSWDICLVKLAPGGQTLWAKRISIPTTNEDVYSTTEDINHYYVVGGVGSGSSAEGLIIKVSKQTGDILLLKRYGGTMADAFNGAIMVGNNLVVCGYSMNPSFTNSTSNRGDGVIVEVSTSTLDTIRTKRIGSNNRFDKFDKVCRSNDGGFLLVGTRAPFLITSPWTPGDNEDVVVTKLDANWSLVWMKVYNHSTLSLYEYPTGIMQNQTGDIYVSVQPLTYSGSVLHRLSEDGHWLGSIQINSAVIRGILSAPFGNSLLLFGYSGSSAFVCEVTNQLSVNWMRKYTFGATSSAGIMGLSVFAGEITSFGFSNGNTKSVLAKMDPYGEIFGCDGLLSPIVTSNFLPDTTRNYVPMFGAFAFDGVSVMGTSESIALSEAECLNIVLPIELSHFSATSLGSKVRLRWVTQSEHEILRFVVEKSQDNTSFTYAFEQSAYGGVFPVEYLWDDQDVKPGSQYYYRLRIEEESGSSFSPTVSVVTPHLVENGQLIYPNPVRVGETISGGVPGVVRLYDLQGRFVEQANNIGELRLTEPSIYFLEFSDGSRLRLVVQ